eukprot:8407607-Heterocapsa_arctica.AAC.1
MSSNRCLKLQQGVPAVHLQHVESPSSAFTKLHYLTLEKLLSSPVEGGQSMREALHARLGRHVLSDVCWALQVWMPTAVLIANGLWTD